MTPNATAEPVDVSQAGAELSLPIDHGTARPKTAQPKEKRWTAQRRERLLTLTQKDFLEGLKCRKALYRTKFHPGDRTDQSPIQKALYKNWLRVLELAHKMWPKSVQLPVQEVKVKERLEATEAAMQNIVTLFSPTFVHDDLVINPDIMAIGLGGYRLCLVSSTVDVQDEHLDDLSFQYHVLNGCGIPLESVKVIRINAEFVLKKGDIDPNEFFVIEDVTEDVAARAEMVPNLVADFRNIILNQECPGDCIGRHCDKPAVCSFKERCWSESVPEGSVLELYNKGVSKYRLWEEGHRLLDDIDLQKCNIKAAGQTRQILTYQARSLHFDLEAVQEFLRSLWYPLHFVDFETSWSNPIPFLIGTKPYQQVPFQYSLHRIEAAGAKVKHTRFIGKPGQDPRLPLIRKMVKEIDPTGCILAYNAPFERLRLEELARDFPAYADQLLAIRANILDMLTPFAKWYVYHWKMRGSHSVKRVLPALLPELSYDSLTIKNGEQAGLAYEEMMLCGDPARVKEIRSDLAPYCDLDTFALVKLLFKLQDLCTTRTWWSAGKNSSLIRTLSPAAAAAQLELTP